MGGAVSARNTGGPPFVVPVVDAFDVVVTIVGIVVGSAILLPLLSHWFRASGSDSTTAQALGAGFAPLENLFDPASRHKQDYLEHEAQAPARYSSGAPPRVQVDLDAGVVIINDSADSADSNAKNGELPYTGPTTERTGPETPEHRS